MDEMNKDNNIVDNNPAGEKKTFSQDDVNRIVQERLAKEKQKGQEELAEKESELAAKEFRLDATAILREKGLPDELADIIKADDIKVFSRNIETILKLIEEKAKVVQEPEVIGRANIIGAVSGSGYSGDPVRKAFGLE